jgi:hypothetical protein
MKLFNDLVLKFERPDWSWEIDSKGKERIS